MIVRLAALMMPAALLLLMASESGVDWEGRGSRMHYLVLPIGASSELSTELGRPAGWVLPVDSSDALVLVQHS